MRLIFVLLILLILPACLQKPYKEEFVDLSMQLTSPAFQNNTLIPEKYTCDSLGISPPLTITNVPKEAKSLVLLMDDPDIPEIAKTTYHIEVWDHWVIFNMSPTLKEIQEGKMPEGTLGKNSRGNLTYGGPCPPDREHRYFFKLYALDIKLDLPAGATKAQVEQAMQNHILTEAILIGRYKRK